jgi:triphosphoribosyl-dephospho-CoA synthase
VAPDVGLFAQVACVWEATARKPGNVHRYRDFDDAGYVDFLLSAAALAPVLSTACQRPVGATVLEAIRATRRAVRTNTNLGIALLLAPLAAVPEGVDLRAGVERVLAGLTVEDARLAYEAIRLAAPGGLGRAPAQDVNADPTQTLREVMALAAGRDRIARQYAGGYADVFDDGAPAVCAGLELSGTVEGAIIHAHLTIMARHPDTLIARKRGPAEAAEAAARARRVLEEGWPQQPSGRVALAELDQWLRAEGNGRNPGATADLVAASLFVLLREGALPLPASLPWSAGDAAAPPR